MRWISSQQLEYPGRNDDPDGLFIPADFHPDPIDWHQCIPPSPQPDIIGVYDGATAWNAGVNVDWNWNATVINGGTVSVTSVPNQETTIDAPLDADEAYITNNNLTTNKTWIYYRANCDVGNQTAGSSSVRSLIRQNPYQHAFTHTFLGNQNAICWSATSPDAWPYNGGAYGGNVFYKYFCILDNSRGQDHYLELYRYLTCKLISTQRIGDSVASGITQYLLGNNVAGNSGKAIIKGFPALACIEA